MDLTRLLLIVGGGYFVLKALGVDLLQGIGPIQDTEPIEEGDVVNTNLPGQPNGETPPVDEEISLSEAMMSVAVGLPHIPFLKPRDLSTLDIANVLASGRAC